MTRQPAPYTSRGTNSVADLLERVLDKGVVIVGDIVVSVLDIELLTLKLRLFIASADTARELGMDWWSSDPFFNSRAQQQIGNREEEQRSLRAENEELRRRVAALEQATHPGVDGSGIPPRAIPADRAATPARAPERRTGQAETTSHDDRSDPG